MDERQLGFIMGFFAGVVITYIYGVIYLEIQESKLRREGLSQTDK